MTSVQSNGGPNYTQTKLPVEGNKTTRTLSSFSVFYQKDGCCHFSRHEGQLFFVQAFVVKRMRTLTRMRMLRPVSTFVSTWGRQNRKQGLHVTASSINPIKTYDIKGTGRNSFVELVTNTGHSLTTDVPKRMGGGDDAPQPVETLLAALLGCTQATAIFVGRNMIPRIFIHKIDFDIQAERDERGALTLPIDETPGIPARLQRIHGTIRVFAKSTLSQEQLAILSKQTEARCPVASMVIASGCNLDVKWIEGMTELSPV